MSEEHTVEPPVEPPSDSVASLVFARLREIDWQTLRADPQGTLQSIKQQTLASTAPGISVGPPTVLNSAALAPLCPTQRAVFILYRRDGLSFEEVARLLDVSTQTVQKALASALYEIVRTVTRTSTPE